MIPAAATAEQAAAAAPIPAVAAEAVVGGPSSKSGNCGRCVCVCVWGAREEAAAATAVVIAVAADGPAQVEVATAAGAPATAAAVATSEAPAAAKAMRRPIQTAQVTVAGCPAAPEDDTWGGGVETGRVAGVGAPSASARHIMPEKGPGWPRGGQSLGRLSDGKPAEPPVIMRADDIESDLS